MNIWIFNHYAIGPNSSGGTRHYDLAKELIGKGHSVTIFASSFNHQTLKEEHFTEHKSLYIEENYDGIKFVWIRTSAYESNNHKRVLNMISYSKRAFKVAKNQNYPPDIVIGSLVHPLAAYVGYKIAKYYNSVFYFEERDLWPQTLIDLGKMSSKNPAVFILSKAETFLFSKAKRVIVLFDKAVGYVENKGVEKDKIIYLPNGFDVNRTSNGLKIPLEIKMNFNKDSNQKIAIYTGAHGRANNLDVILDSAKRLEHGNLVKFILIGHGPEKKRLMDRVHSENINNVTFLDPVPKEMIPEILKNADIGLLPLVDSPVFRWGISPNKLFDYMGASLPVLLLCNLEDTPVERSKGGKVIKGNFEDGIVDFCEKTNSNELKIMGSNARSYVEKHHSWKNLALKLEEKMLTDIDKNN